MPRITSAHWNAAALRLGDMLSTDHEHHLLGKVCEIRAADPECESGPDCPHKEHEDAADEALSIAEVLVERRVEPSLAAFLGTCLATALCEGERYDVASESTDETLSEWARRLVDTGTGGVPDDDDDDTTEELLGVVAQWSEHGDDDKPMPLEAERAIDELLVRAFGDDWANACAAAVGRA